MCIWGPCMATLQCRNAFKQLLLSILFSFSLFRINVGHGDELLQKPFCQAGYIPASEANVQLVGH